jgi:predicted metal-dependent phosphoesterase TrpH
MKFIDLHVHTSYSDGTFSPKEIVKLAKDIGLAAISITDHDITGAVPEATEEGKKLGLEIVSGVELSAEIEANGSREMHILGYFIDNNDPVLQERLKYFRDARIDRAWKIYDKLAKLNMILDKNVFQKIAESGSIGRLHFANELVKEGYAKNISEVFQKFLGGGKPAYVPKARLTPKEAIELINKAGGVAVLAHPMIGNFYEETILTELVSYGLKGMEVWHTKHPQLLVQNLLAICNKMGLVPTGGSDCHGMVLDGSILMGKVKVPYETVEKLRALTRPR